MMMSFIKLRAMAFHSEDDLLDEALGYIYYYNNLREHSSLNYETPFAYLQRQLPQLDENIDCFQPFMLDDVSVKLGQWSGAQ